MTVDCRPDLAGLWPVAHDVALDHVILLRRSSSDLHQHSTCQPLAAAGSEFGAELRCPSAYVFPWLPEAWVDCT